jgi:hypothetical protein
VREAATTLCDEADERGEVPWVAVEVLRAALSPPDPPASPAEGFEAATEVEAEERLTLIARNANAWHHDAEAKQRALNVIAAWASGGEIPAVLLADLRGNPAAPATEKDGGA